MADLKVEVCKVDQVVPHPNADRLDLCVVKGWQTITGRGEFQAGDLVVFVPPDAVIPSGMAEQLKITTYLKKGTRTQAIRLRGEPSLGLVIPVADLSWREGDDVAGYYGITKYEPPIVQITPRVRRRPSRWWQRWLPFWLQKVLRLELYYPHPGLLEHPLMPRYTDIENLRHYPTLFEEGEPVIVTEKIHGCLGALTRITMADNSTKAIQDIVVGDSVLGTDVNNRVVPTLVTNVFRNGKTHEWLNVRGDRRAAGRGNAFFSVHCTPNHEFYACKDEQYVPANQLKIGDSILILRSDYGLLPLQEQVILGKLLGDGYLQLTASSGILHFRHKAAHEEYVDWTLRGLGDIAFPHKAFATSGYGSAMVLGKSIASHDASVIFRDFYGPNGKVVPTWVLDKIGPIALAFWYMDDGSLAHQDDQEDRANLATNAFDEPSVMLLQECLRKFDITSRRYNAAGWRLRLNADDAEKLFLLIAPYVPTIMQYKLPERYRGHAGWLPSGPLASYKSALVEQVIREVRHRTSSLSGGTQRFDIETETHNFFAHGVLVHNSNVRLGLVRGPGGGRMAGSHRIRRPRPWLDRKTRQPRADDKDAVLYWYPWTIPSVKAMLTDLGKSHRQVVLYGEIYGEGIQSLTYGVGKDHLGFAAFDLILDGKYQDYCNFSSLCRQYGVTMVPLLGEGPFSDNAIKHYARGVSQLDSNTLREGVVVRPFIERTHPKIGRMILKYCSDAYLIRQVEDLRES